MGFKERTIAEETITFINNGGYNSHKFSTDINKAVVYTPKALEELAVAVPDEGSNAKISLYTDDTCRCAGRFVSDGYTCILNFASAKNIGGGFLTGAVAQEEAVCRSSTLYASISSSEASEYYDFNNSHYDEFYSDYMIFSPTVEVIRDEQQRLLGKPYTICAITAPAVNLHRVKKASAKQVYSCMLKRCEYILKIAVSNHAENIVLGAWGCGVFGNNPYDIAKMFKYLLTEKGYIRAFRNVAFSIYGKKSDNYAAFESTFKDML